MTTSTIGTGSRNYSTIDAWMDACPADITAAGTNEIWRGECYNDSEFVLGAKLEFQGEATTDASHYFHLTVASGQGFRHNAGAATLPLRYDQSKGVGVRATGSYASLVRTDSTNVLIEGLQLKSERTASGAYTQLAGTGLILKDCIIESTCPNNFSDGSNHPVTYINCVIALTGTSFTSRVGYGGEKFYNCLVVRPSDLSAGSTGFENASSTYPTVKNTAVFGFTTPFAGTIGSYPGACSNNASAASSGNMPGSNNQHSLTFADQFENVNNATRDWRPKSGSALLGNGTRDQTNTADLDIIGGARSTSTPAIGPREPLAGGIDLAGAAIAAASASATLTVQRNLAAAAVAGALASGALAITRALSAAAIGRAVGSAALQVYSRVWRLPTNAPNGTAVHVTVFSGASPTYAILAQGTAIVAGGFVDLPGAGTSGTKAFCFVHNYNDNTAVSSIRGGPAIATLTDI